MHEMAVDLVLLVQVVVDLDQVLRLVVVVGTVVPEDAAGRGDDRRHQLAAGSRRRSRQSRSDLRGGRCREALWRGIPQAIELLADKKEHLVAILVEDARNPDRTAEGVAEIVVLQWRLGCRRANCAERVGLDGIVAEVLVDVAMEVAAATLDGHRDSRARRAALAGRIGRSYVEEL